MKHFIWPHSTRGHLSFALISGKMHKLSQNHIKTNIQTKNGPGKLIFGPELDLANMQPASEAMFQNFTFCPFLVKIVSKLIKVEVFHVFPENTSFNEVCFFLTTFSQTLVSADGIVPNKVFHLRINPFPNPTCPKSCPDMGVPGDSP